MSFKPNIMELGVWGNHTSVESGQKKGLKKMNRKGVKVSCVVCFRRMNKRAMLLHRKQEGLCFGARSEME